ncbi:hypothetical protein [Pararhizobium sp. DWP1-1-3]|uniref:hypothetical protein n=1 Tax=Pararhizobium sp. DWP1-1-3 TaxID=2804652 RepID=UPI003CEE0074
MIKENGEFAAWPELLLFAVLPGADPRLPGDLGAPPGDRGENHFTAFVMML